MVQVLCEELSYLSRGQTDSEASASASTTALIDVIANRNHYNRLGSWCLNRPDVVTNFHITEALVEARLKSSSKCTKENLEMDNWMLGILDQSLAQVLQGFDSVIAPLEVDRDKYNSDTLDPSKRLQSIGWDAMGDFFYQICRALASCGENIRAVSAAVLARSQSATRSRASWLMQEAGAFKQMMQSAKTQLIQVCMRGCLLGVWYGNGDTHVCVFPRVYASSLGLFKWISLCPLFYPSHHLNTHSLNHQFTNPLARSLSHTHTHTHTHTCIHTYALVLI